MSDSEPEGSSKYYEVPLQMEPAAPPPLPLPPPLPPSLPPP